jgi:hypothetical protein
MTQIAEPLAGFLDSPLISRVRRNHGLEHATLHILAERHPGLPMAGHSDWRGFWIVGDLETADLSSAVDEALRRMNNGESQLAVHPFCGTNMVTAGVLAGGAAALAMFGAGRRLQDKLERLPLAMSLATLALIAAQPVGMALQQQVTTSGRPGNLQVISILPKAGGRVKTHRIVTEG